MFPLIKYADILERIDSIDPVAYCKSRNYGSGSITMLSPYISRGVISTRFVLERILARGYRPEHIMKFIDELCWRDYFQLIGRHRTETLTVKDTLPQSGVVSDLLPAAVLNASTGTDVIDDGIRLLYATGYMHNHLRMYTAMLVTNIARTHWFFPAQWMYYHLLDADFASNACSWQWVSGVRSKKKYYANQENMNKYFGSAQQGTIVDCSYEELSTLTIPEILEARTLPEIHTTLPEYPAPVLRPGKPVLVYTHYNLDPLWHNGTDADRILLLEPTAFRQYPMAKRTIDFIIALSGNIPGIQIACMEFDELKKLAADNECIYKEHPLTRHFTGREEPRDFIVPEVDEVYPSFFAYKKKIEKRLPGITQHKLQISVI